MARFDTVLSFSRDDPEAADQPTNEDAAVAHDSDDDSDAGFEFAFAPPLAASADGAVLAPADDLFAHGRILPAYPVFDRRASLHQDDPATSPRAAPEPDSYCAWAPRSAPGSPARAFPKSASTGEARRFWRLRDLVGGRSHSDGKDKFLFLQPGAANSASKTTKVAAEGEQQAKNKNPSAAAPPLQQQKQKQGKKKGAVTEMDMATAHKLFYGKQQQQQALPGERRQQHSYLPYRTGIVGFFASAHAIGRSHHPY